MPSQARERELNWNSAGLGPCLNSVTKQQLALGKPSNFSVILSSPVKWRLRKIISIFTVLPNSNILGFYEKFYIL